MPQVWELQEQAEADEAKHEVDLLLQEHLEGAQDMEIEEVESFAQELQTMVPKKALLNTHDPRINGARHPLNRI